MKVTGAGVVLVMRTLSWSLEPTSTVPKLRAVGARVRGDAEEMPKRVRKLSEVEALERIWRVPARTVEVEAVVGVNWTVRLQVAPGRSVVQVVVEVKSVED